jgi:AcrR family transcriptional regulator
MDERREQLLELGLDVFGASPSAALSIDDIAAAGGISRGLLYHYFPSKRDFYVAVVQRAADLMDASTRTLEEVPIEERARHAVRVFLEAIAERRELYGTLLSGGTADDAEVRAIVDASREAFATRALHACGIEEPTARQWVAARGWIGFVEAASLAWLEAGEPERETLVSVYLRTLRAAVTDS